MRDHVNVNNELKQQELLFQIPSVHAFPRLLIVYKNATGQLRYDNGIQLQLSAIVCFQTILPQQPIAI